MSEGTEFILREISLKRFEEEEQKILTHVLAEVKSGIPGDFDGDGEVDFDDFFIFAAGFGLSAEMPGFDPGLDLKADGVVDFSDFFIFAENFGRRLEDTMNRTEFRDRKLLPSEPWERESEDEGRTPRHQRPPPPDASGRSEPVPAIPATNRRVILWLPAGAF